MAKTRLKADFGALLCVLVFWAVNRQTDCVPKATATVLTHVVKVTPHWQSGYECLGRTHYRLGRYEEGDRLANRPISFDQVCQEKPCLEKRI